MTDLANPSPAARPAPAPGALRRQLARLAERRDLLRADRDARSAQRGAVTDSLDVAPAVGDALDKLSEDLFGRLVTAVERQLTYALREVLEQPIALKVNRDFLHGAVSLSFHV